LAFSELVAGESANCFCRMLALACPYRVVRVES
jgi:hypothetical protein